MPASGPGDLMFQLLSQAFTGMFSPKRQDGLKALSVGGNAWGGGFGGVMGGGGAGPVMAAMMKQRLSQPSTGGEFNANGTPRNIPGYGPNPFGLFGRDLVGYWSSLDANTPDKLDWRKARDLAAGSPGSLFGQWFNGAGFGKRGSIMGASAYNRALSGGGGGSWGMQGNMDFVRFMGQLIG